MKGTEFVDYIADGRMDFKQLNENFEQISDDIDELDTRVDLEESRQFSQSLTILLENNGYITILEAKEHGNLNIKLIHASIQAADNIKENVTVHILRGNKDICEPQTIKSTEKAGKCQSFNIFQTQIVGKIEAVKLYSSSRRKVLVHLIFSTFGVKQ